MKLEFRRAHTADPAGIMPMIAAAQCFMARQGLDQWQNGYPSAQRIGQDIEDGIGYLLCADGAPAVYGVLTFQAESSYLPIYGKAWRPGEPYATLHRLAAAAQHRGSGLAGIFLGQLEALAKKGGATILRTDTHPANLPMQRFLDKNGYDRRGTIYLKEFAGGGQRGDERVGFDKLL